MLSSKIFKFTNILDNEKFVKDLSSLEKVDEITLKHLLDYQKNEKLKNHSEELLFKYFEDKGINLNKDETKSSFSVIYFIESFYNEHSKYIDELDDVKKDLLNKDIINDKNNDYFSKNLEIIYSSLNDIRVTSNILKYKEDFLPIIKDVTYSTNMKLIKSTFNSYANCTNNFDKDVADIITSTTLKIELSGEEDVLLQLSKDNIDDLIKVLEYAKNDVLKSNELIRDIKLKK